MKLLLSMPLSMILLAGSLSSAQAEPAATDPLQEGNEHLEAMQEATRGMTFHINRATASGDLTVIRQHTEEAIRFGEEMNRHARAAITALQKVQATAQMRTERSRTVYATILHLKMIASHCQEAVALARLSLEFKSIPSVLKGVQESAIHTRHAAMHALEGEHHLHNIAD